ncbi:MAG: hypothetical protein Q3M24_03990 [Candidatus Electrothrix aestuarii]|uniref:DUF4476 domain-containing protein n=1 Tax=Candidatus Electrothrix aestuarii TaxID=3062594 RepID=A0AAU8LWJ7_9BACT|nr:hypothetical protein [Candidatus Electrothrix aestuarii]
MKKIVLFTLSLCILSVFSAQANQTRVTNNVTVNTVNTVNTVVMNTGDVQFDQFLTKLNTVSEVRLDVYITDLCNAYQVPAQRVRRLIHKRRMSPADVLLVLQFSHMTGAPLKRVLQRYREHHSRGWQAIFNSYEIYPGSRFFLILRNEIPTIIVHYVEQGWSKGSKKKGSKKRKGSKRKKGSKKKGSKRK